LLKAGYGQYPGLGLPPVGPPGVTAAQNYQRASESYFSGIPGATEYKLYDWTAPHHEMDYKNTVDPKYERFGNYNFGAVAAGLGIPKEEAKRAAGYAQKNYSEVGTSKSGTAPSIVGVFVGGVSVSLPGLPVQKNLDVINGGSGDYEDFGEDQQWIDRGYNDAINGLLR
jgi:hypothetical protein